MPSSPIDLLLIAPDPSERAALCEMLSDGYRVRDAATLSAAVEAMLDDPPRLVVVRNEADGAKVIRRLRLTAAREPLGILALLAEPHTRRIVEATQAGADDVLIAPEAHAVRAALERMQASQGLAVHQRANRTLPRRTRPVYAKGQPQRIARWEWNVQTGEQTWAPSTYALLRYDPATTMPSFEAFVARIHPDDRAMVQRITQHMLETETPRPIEFRLRYPNGEEAQVYADCELIRDAKGAMQTFIGLALDMTERTLSQIHLEKYAAQAGLLQEFSRALQVHGRDMQGVLDAVVNEVAGRLGYTCVVLFKEADQRLRAVAYRHPEPEGQTFIKKLFHEAIIYADRGVHAPVFTEGRPVVLMHVDPIAYRAEMQPDVRPYFDQYGVDSVILVPIVVNQEVIGSFDIVRHRPDRWLSEDDVGFVQDLADRAAMAIENARLFQELEANRIALEQKVRDLNQFAYIASHDLKAPLRTMNGFIRLLERRHGEILEQTGDYFDFIKSAASDMQALIDDLLLFSRASNRPLDLNTLDLNDVVEPVLRMLRGVIEEKEADVTVGELPMVFGDERYLKQVFQNLIGNALKFSGDVPPVITVSAEAKGPIWHVKITDNGIGIEENAYERIFQIFQRLHAHDEYEGTGIGLALTAKIMERHGGQVDVQSVVGQGSTFTLTFFNAGTDGALASAR